MDLNKQHKVYDDAIDYRIIGNRAIILNASSTLFYTLEDAGALIWKMLVDHKTVEEIVRCALDEYEVSQEEFGRDIQELIEEMEKERLIKPL